MGTKTFNNYEDLLTFTRASGGHALRPVSYGTELVTNGDFTNNIDGWLAVNASATLTAENNELKVVNTATSGARLTSSITVEVGKLYTVSATSTSATDSHMLRLGSTSATAIDILSGTNSTVPTTFTHTFLATSPDLWIYLRNSAAGTTTWDNVSVKEVTFDKSDGTLTLFEHPDNIPRVEWDAQRNRLGLLVEEARTNLIPYSEDFNSWGKVRSTVNTDVIQAPDGTTTGDALVATAVNDDHAVGQAVSVTAQPYTFTAFIKAGDKSFVRLWQTNDSILADFDLTNLTVGYTLGSPSATSIEDVGNGWRRCSITMTPTAGTRTFRIYAMEADNDKLYLGDGSTEDIYIWGAQVEAGSFPTSYIKSNSGSTTTRSADVASIPVADFGYNQSAGSVVIESQTFDITDVGRNFSLSDGTSSNVIRSQSQASNHLIVFKSGALTANLDAGSYSNNVFSKLGGAFAEDDIAACLDGGTVATDTSSSIPRVTKLHIGGRYDGGLPLNGHVKSIKYYPRRLTNAQLQEITT